MGSDLLFSLTELYAERYDWLIQQFKDWAFTFCSSFLYYEKYDKIDETARELYRQGMNAMPDAESVPTSNVPGFGDLQLSMFLAGGVAGALYNREKTGKGDYVNVSLYHGLDIRRRLRLGRRKYRHILRREACPL